MSIVAIYLDGLSHITLPVTSSLPNDPYILKEADGLGPPEVDISIAETASTGGYYQGRRPRNREIVLRVGLNPTNNYPPKTAAELRQDLYRLFSTVPITVTITFEYSESYLGVPQPIVAEGYLKRIEIVPFSKEPEVQVVMSCLSPYFHHAQERVITDMSETEPYVYNWGVAPSGFRADLTLHETLDRVTLYTIPFTQDKYLEVVNPFAAGDSLIFDTRLGQRAVLFRKNPETWYTDITHKLAGYSRWFDIVEGTNYLWIGTSAGHTGPVQYTWNELRFMPQDWGI